MSSFLPRAIASLLAASLLVAAPAYARPGDLHNGRPGDHGDVRHDNGPPIDRARRDDRGTPPNWGQSQWRYRQDWLQRHGHDRDDHDSSTGLVVGAILGFVLGAAIADSQEHQAAAQHRLSDQSWQDDCARRYRSFDRDSGTFLGYDGLRHYCQ